MPETQSAIAFRAVQPIACAPAQESTALRRTVLVQRFPLFSNVAQADCREMVSAAREHEFSRGETMFLEGDPIQNVILLTSGSAKVMQVGKNGTEVILRLVGPGGLVGLIGSLGPSHHSSTAQAHRDSKALVWEARVFEALADRFPVLGRNILSIVSRQLEELEERYREIATENVAARLSRQLVRLFSQVGRQVNGTIEVSLSREELAQLTGTTLFTVSRLLSEWDDRGVVAARRESVSVRNVAALELIPEALGA